MMKPLAVGLAAVSLLMGSFSCTSPYGTSPRAPGLGSPEETTLVFHAGQTSRAFVDLLADSGYLALELKLLSDGSQRSFATATKDVNGDFVVVVPGLVAGDWRLRAYFYRSEASAELLLYARQTEYLAPGQVRDDIVLSLYQPGTIGGVVPDGGLDPHHLGIDPDGSAHSSSAAPRILPVGEQLPLLATVYSSRATGIPDEFELADSQLVTWTSSDSEVARVSASGRITASAPGVASITATSVDNPAVDQVYWVRVVAGLEGSWLKPAPDEFSSNELFRFHNGKWVYFQWDSYEALVFRGSYTLRDSQILMTTEGILPPGQVDWIPWSTGWDMPQYLNFNYSVSSSHIIFFQKDSSGGPKIAIDSDSSSGSLRYDLEFEGDRVAEDPLSLENVAFTALAPDGDGNVFAEDGDLVDFTTSISDATVNRLVWVSDNASVVDFQSGGYTESDVVQTGTAVLRGYALDALDYPGSFETSGIQPILTLVLTVTLPPDVTGPAISTSDIGVGANFSATIPFSFEITVSDPSGPSNSVPLVTIDGGSIVPDAITQVADGVFQVDVPASAAGSYNVEITAWDSLNNPNTINVNLEVLPI